MDPTNSDINQSDNNNEERKKKSAFKCTLYTLKRWANNLNEWSRKYMPTIELTAVTAAVAALYFIYLQVDGISKQTEAIVDQNKAIRDQNEAIWFSTRPKIRVNAVDPKKDLILDEEFSNFFTMQTGDSIEVYSISFTVENVGSSFGKIDSIGFEYVNSKNYSADSVFKRQMTIAPGAAIRQGIAGYPISKNVISYMKLSVYYSWNEFAKSTLMDPFVIYHSVEYAKNSWAVLIWPENDYDSVVSEILFNMEK